MLFAIQKRRSCRAYIKTPIDGKLLEKIKKIVDSVNQESGLNIELLEDGAHAFSSIKATYGLFKNVRSVLVMKADPELEDYREKIGYFGEKLILEIVGLGLGTCWVGGTFDKSAIEVSADEEVTAVVVIGYEDKKSVKGKILGMSHKRRKSIEDRIESDEELSGSMKNGMEAVVLAPSAMNRQKPKFKYSDGILTAEVKDDVYMDLIDLGIAKLHFEIGAGDGKFEFGNGGRYIPER